MSDIEDAIRPKLEMMNQAVEYVMALGYQPSECLIELRQDASGFVDVDRLLVRGEPFFEIKTQRPEFVEVDNGYRINLIFVPRVISWPPAPTASPQVPASLTDE